MKSRLQGWWMIAALLGAVGPAARADLVTPPAFTSIYVPATAALNDQVGISATAEAYDSDNSDGNDWNYNGQDTILRIIVDYLPPNGSWTNLNDWMPDWTSPNSASPTLTLNQPGTWYVRFQAMDGRPWYSSQLTYEIVVSPPPGPQITSSLSVSVNQGQDVSYQISATNSPSSFGASNLPAGLSFNSSTGVISGHLTASSNVSSSISATNAYGTDTQTLTWYVTAASISPAGSVAPQVAILGQLVALTRGGTANFGVAWTEGTIWRPNGSAYTVGTLGLGSSTYAPDGGSGVYWYRYRLVDNYYNYVDQWIVFYVADINPLTVTISGGATVDGRTTNPVIEFGQSVTVNATAYDPSGQMIVNAICGDFGITGNWAVYNGGWVDVAACSTNSFSATYQPSGVNNGQHWMAAFGYSNGWWGRGYYLIVNKSTPTASFASRTFAPSGSTGTYTITTSDLNAAFSNPYSSGVSGPGGAPTYTVVGPGTAVQPGTQFGAGTYTIQASYAGDSNYNSRTATATFTVTGPTAPGSLQATTVGSTLVTLGWTASSSPAGILRYDVYRNGSLVGSSTTLSFTDSSLNPTTAYTYTVRAIDNNSNASAFSAAVNVTTLVGLEVFTPLP